MILFLRVLLFFFIFIKIIHYENTHIQIHWKFDHEKMKIFR